MYSEMIVFKLKNLFKSYRTQCFSSFGDKPEGNFKK